MPKAPDAYIRTRAAPLHVIDLPVEGRHAAHAGSLPAIHRDPFDRLIVSQAILDDLTVVTADPAFARYPVRVMQSR